MSGVSASQRWSKARRCPKCGGCEGDPRGKEKRCLGFLMTGGEAYVCTRVESDVPTKDGPTQGWVHRLVERRREEPEAIYSYRDEQGEELFQVVRFPGKKILQRRHEPGHPDAKAGGYVWSVGNARRVLYRLPEILAADRAAVVYVAEGEKDVDTLTARGLVATCNPHGAGPGKWERTADLARTVLAGRTVIVIADADDEGRPHGKRTAASLSDVAAVRLVECTKGKDITDHLAAGGTLDEMTDLASDPAPPDGAPPPGMFDDEPEPPPPDLHRAPEAEARLVASAMISPECLAVAAEIVQLADFTDAKLAMIWGACLEAKGRGHRADPVMVATCLRGHGSLDEVGGLDALSAMANAVAVLEPGPEESRGHASMIRTRSIERRVLDIVRTGAADLEKANGTTTALAARLAGELSLLTASSVERPRFEILTGADLAIEEPPLTYLVEALGLVDGAGPPHMIAGAGYSGKTMICQDMLLSMASGRHVWGAYGVSRPRRVIHVDLEQGRQLTKLRYRRLALARGIELESLGDMLEVVCYPKGLRLTPDHWRDWQHLMVGRDSMLIDSVRVAAAGLDENSSEFRESLDMLGSLSKETSCRAIGIHHLRKESKEAGPMQQELLRGSSAIFEALDACLILKKRDGEDVTLSQAKARSRGECIDPFSILITDVPGPSGHRKWGLRVSVAGLEHVEEQRRATAEAASAKETRSLETRIRSALSARPDQTADEIAHRIRARKQAVIGALLDMAVTTSTRESDPECGGRPRRIYRLT
jgi:hypothetical protein